MCGIVGYVGPRKALPVLLDGLKRLEYRGYDSAGIALIADGSSIVQKAAGKIATLESQLGRDTQHANIGIAHTRWATHGAPTSRNAHPHTDCAGNIAVAHNGIIENHTALRQLLVAKGHRFPSETDTEVLAHLIEQFYQRLAGAGGGGGAPGSRGDVRHRGDLGQRAGHDRRGAQRQPAAAGPRHRRELRGVRSLGRAGLHAVGGLPRRGQPGRGHGVRLPGEGPPRRAGEQGSQPDRLGPRDHRAGRLPALHAEGDLRAAGEHPEHAAGPIARGGGHRALRRAQPHRRGAARASTGSC